MATNLKAGWAAGGPEDGCCMTAGLKVGRTAGRAEAGGCAVLVWEQALLRVELRPKAAFRKYLVLSGCRR